MRQIPQGYRGHPAWLAFEKRANDQGYGTQTCEWMEYWLCFIAGFGLGLSIPA